MTKRRIQRNDEYAEDDNDHVGFRFTIAQRARAPADPSQVPRRAQSLVERVSNMLGVVRLVQQHFEG